MLQYNLYSVEMFSSRILFTVYCIGGEKSNTVQIWLSWFYYSNSYSLFQGK